MEINTERDSSVLGSLFQQIINDMKNTSPLWEDFVAKASKLHACLRAAIQAIAAYLDAFQKIADAATNSRGASKEIGTALTRVCLRHKAVETRLKTFTAAIMDCLVQPLQDKLEDWKRSVATIDKEHAKEYKRCRTELKKRSTDTLRLQKKARKGQSDTLQSLMDSHMQDVTLRRAELEEVEKKSLRSAMIEERMRYCSFVYMLQPVVKEECEVMSELGHLQEAMQSIALVTKEPQVLPAASEELIHDAKASITLYPESPSAGGGGSLSQGGCSNSLGSRKSSVCSISSMNSSGSSNSPGHPHYPRSLSQASSINNPSHAVTTWPTHSQDTVDIPSNASERPHTISSAYEKGHQRPPLTVYTFQNPETIHEGGVNPVTNNGGGGGSSSGQNTPSTQKSPAGALTRPPLPVRCSSLERPLSANNSRGNGSNLLQRQCPSPIPAHVTKELSAHLAQQQHQQQQQQLLLQQQQQQLNQQQQQQTSPPTYVNMSELANMAAMKITNQQQQQLQQQLQQQQQSPTIHQQMLQQQHSIDSISSIHSNDSTASMTQNQFSQQQMQQHIIQTTPPSHQQPTRPHSSNSNTPSLHSHPSIDSNVATPPIGQTPSASSGSSTPQNHYSPLLTNSPSSTAAGTPSGASITSGGMTTSGAAGGNNSGNNFMYNICSPTPPQSANSSLASDSILKITEPEGNNGNAMPPPPPQSSSSSTLPSQTNETNASCSSYSANNQEISNSNNDADSSGNVVENDERSRASVLQKASMFEKQAAAVKSTPNPPANSATGMTRQSAVAASAAGTAASTNVDYGTNSGIYGTRTITNQHQQHQSQSIDPQEVGSTRIARRSSVNTAKPPPPVRRSSSVTPSPNTPTTPTNTNATNMLHQHAHSLNTSTENLPPPPAFLLDAKQATPTSPSSLIPNSSQKVSETVKALSGLRHQPASPHTLRRLQQQQHQQQQQQPILQPNKQHQHQYTKSSPVLLSPPATKRTMPTPPTPLSPQTCLQQSDLNYDIPPSLPPQNPNHAHSTYHQHQLSLPVRYQQQLPTANMTAYSNSNQMSPQQFHYHQQQPLPQQQQQQQHYQEQSHLDVNSGDAIYGTNSPSSFRTSSPSGGIYAQPKILNNMSSFRTNSPGPNGHQTPTQSHVPAQPKTNPNLIAQLNARLNTKQQNSNEAIYGVSTVNHQQQREEIYMRNYQQQQQQQQHTQMSPHQAQPPQTQQNQQQLPPQQQTYDAGSSHLS